MGIDVNKSERKKGIKDDGILNDCILQFER
jgi:hypothetical protein